MIQLLKSRLGVALETAILFMLTLSVLSILLTTAVLSAYNASRVSDRQSESLLEIEQFGEYFVSGDTEKLNAEADKYHCQIENNTLTLTSKSSGKVALYIELDENRSVTCWRYSEPTE